MKYLPQKINSRPMTGKAIRKKKYKEDFDFVHFNARQALILCCGCITVRCRLQRSDLGFPPSFAIPQRNKAKPMLALKKAKDLDAGNTHLKSM